MQHVFAGGVGTAVQASVLKESVLLQLADLSCSSYDESLAPERAAASQAAHKVLLTASSTPSHGLLHEDLAPNYLVENLPLHEAGLTPHSDAASDGLPVLCRLRPAPTPLLLPGKSLLGLLRKLQFQRSVQHLELLTHIVNASPAAAASVLNNCDLSLEPKGKGAVEIRAGLAALCIAQSATHASTLHSALARNRPPPSIDSSGARNFLSRCLPRAFTRASLSKCLQHDQPATVAAALTVLSAALRALAPVCAAMRTAATAPPGAAKPAGVSNAALAPAWATFRCKFLHDVRARLPELQTLLLLHSVAIRCLCVPATAVEAVPRSKNKRADASIAEKTDAVASDGPPLQSGYKAEGWSAAETHTIIALLLEVLLSLSC